MYYQNEEGLQYAEQIITLSKGYANGDIVTGPTSVKTKYRVKSKMQAVNTYNQVLFSYNSTTTTIVLI
jgi:hypothetical protein